VRVDKSVSPRTQLCGRPILILLRLLELGGETGACRLSQVD
jgi:hypothetical protein